MEIHWRNAQEIDESGRDAAVRALDQLAEAHRDLIDLWIDIEASSGHHRAGKRRVEIRCQARGAELVVHGEAEEIGLALREALRVFKRRVKRLRSQRRDVRSEQPVPPPVRGMIDRIEREQGFGFLITDAGERVYFHRNAVGGGLDFEGLEEGRRVALDYEAGVEGLQAKFVKPLVA